ncbi:MAG: STN and carboxypeptidase regulatory-like domain-containing protein [Candidatus Pseudobacter hemicellulosilyticus]|uniref:STN and carboxypeptidase regulatory-like domain-containing protein n=1 Tax=Candidatus Pseudobacter hemicellulosilyticus TaxID=3121375 RepID=A0AAJ6BHP3_9BACT|nr:MAG: STN and carboxypeptidase regulatory-like domain-containing protein [Pseudobacter sp.]
MDRVFKKIVPIAMLCLAMLSTEAQNILNRSVSLEVNRQELAHVLEILSNKGNFFFSYNSNIIRKDSLVTLSVYSKTVKQVLDLLFREGYEFKESGNYLILRRTPIRTPLVTHQDASEESVYYVSGYVLDDQTGQSIGNASVYEKHQLASTISNSDGYFRLKLKSRYEKAAISVSKQYYVDTTVIIQPRYNQQLAITINPLAISDNTTIIAPYSFAAPDSIVIDVRGPDSTHWLYTYRKTDSNNVEKTAMGQWLLSTWQKVQTINLDKFFTARPYQMSLVPGMSTNGRLNSQVTNNVSLNILGGYSGGVNGVEIGGLFNIDKRDVKIAQAGGLFNMVGGNLTGVQLAAVHNTVLDSVVGVQIGGITNHIHHNLLGVQVGGIYNHVSGSTNGAQISGIGNYNNHDFIGWQLSGKFNVNRRDLRGSQMGGVLNINGRNLKGAQLAGILNVNWKTLHGAQVAGVLNYAKRLKGVQIGLVNIADTSDGYSIGLVNIIFKGYHKLSIYANEVIPFNAAFKTGNTKLYSILLAGVSAGYGNESDSIAKAFTFGYGMGRELSLKNNWGLNAELTSQHIYLGSWDYLNLLSRASFHVHYKVGKYFSVFAGPSFSVYCTNQTENIKGYREHIPSWKDTFTFGDRVTGWFGFNAGINLF